MNTSQETKRLRIRPLLPEDSSFIIKLLNSESWIEFIGDRKVHNIDDARDYIREKNRPPHYTCHVFEDKTSRVPLGILTFIQRPDLNFPDIGFAILPQYEKKGYTIEAASAYLKACQESHSADEILAITLPHNKRSINLLEHLGMHFQRNQQEEGTSYLVYSTRAPEPQSKEK